MGYSLSIKDGKAVFCTEHGVVSIVIENSQLPSRVGIVLESSFVSLFNASEEGRSVFANRVSLEFPSLSISASLNPLNGKFYIGYWTLVQQYEDLEKQYPLAVKAILPAYGYAIAISDMLDKKYISKK